jgi:hypothetical protein
MKKGGRKAPLRAQREKKGSLPNPSPATLRQLAHAEPDNPKAACPTFGGKQRVLRKQARVCQILLRHKETTGITMTAPIMINGSRKVAYGDF